MHYEPGMKIPFISFAAKDDVYDSRVQQPSSEREWSAI
jgi:hypothetical protein